MLKNNTQTRSREVQLFIPTGFVLFLIMFTTGCGATIAYECLVGPECDSDPSVRYYHAVNTDLELWNTPEDSKISEFGTWFHRGIIIGDTPISFVVDTVLAPFQFFKSVIQGDHSDSPEPMNMSMEAAFFFLDDT